MLIHPWDAGVSEDEWTEFVRAQGFGHLIASGHDRDIPVVVPTQFALADAQTVLLHLARPNPVWKALEADAHVVLALTGDYTYVEAEWNTEPGADPAYGVPTSYYTAVQLLCRAEVVDDPEEKAAILARQLDHFEPADSGRVMPSPDNESDRRQLPGIRGLRLQIESVRAKMKYGGNKEPDHRREIADHLAGRDGPLDAAARANLLRRLDD